MRKCLLYEKTKGKIRCLACAHYCLIEKNKTGICGVRKNIENKLFLLVYGKLSSICIDPIEKKPLYHFMPGTKTLSIGTVGCNFKCDFCQNFEISQNATIPKKNFKPEEIIEKAILNECPTISYTYNEPTIFIEFVKDVSKIAKKKGLKNVLVTNGYLSKESLELISNYIDAMNIDLKSFNEKFYLKNCKAKLQPVLETIKKAKQKKIWIEITTLLIPKENDSDKELNNIARFISSIDKNIPWHISRFFPRYKMTNKNPTDLKKIEKAFSIGKKYLNYVYIGNVQTNNQTICPNCKEVIIERFGYLVKSRMREEKCFNCGEKISGIWNKTQNEAYRVSA